MRADADAGTAVEIDAVLARAAGVRNAAEAEIVDLVARVIEDDSWRGEGIRSVEHWVTWKLGADRSRARRYIQIARRRAELPHANELFDRGRLSIDQMALISRRCPADFDLAVAEFAVSATIPQLCRTLRDYHFDSQTDTGSEAGEVVPEEPRVDPIEAVSFSLTEDRYRLLVTGNHVDGLRIKAALQQAMDRLLDDRDPAEGWGVRSYEALLHLIETGAGADPSMVRQRRTQVLVHLDLDERDRWTGRLHLGEALPAAALRLLTCEADTNVVLERFGRSLRLGRSHRTVPDWLRVLVVDRDGGCRVPGCGQKLGLDVHHIRHWVDGGDTDPGNLVSLCRRHHTQLHQGELALSGDPARVPAPTRSDGLTFRNRHGTRIRCRPPDPGPSPARQSAVYRHPLGERLRSADVFFAPDAPQRPT